MEGQRTLTLDAFDRFPPTVVDHARLSDGLELQLLDPGTRERPRFIWIPDADDEDSVAQL